MISRQFTQEEISTIITHLKSLFPEYDITQCLSDPKFIRFHKIIGEQKVDTIPVSVNYSENVHIYECYCLVYDPSYPISK